MYRAIIVDDEPLARKDLKAVLSSFSQIEIVGEADSVGAAKNILTEYKPNLVFLDIQMPGETGFDLLEFIDPAINVIFVTAYDEFALRAFEVNARDYLLKPVAPDRLALSLERLESNDSDRNEMQKKLQAEDSIFLKLNDSYRFIRIKTITYISAADDYTELHLETGKKLLVYKTMKEWEHRLPEQQFCRIHRSTIVNIEKVTEIQPWHNNAYLVSLADLEKPVVMSRRYLSRIKITLG